MQLENNNDEEKKTSIAFFATYRPPVPLALYSCPYPSIKSNGHVNGRTCSTIDDFDRSETHMTDDKESYDYNGQFIQPETLMLILEQPVLKNMTIKNELDVAAGGILFVSERGIDDKHDEGLELLYIAIRLKSLVKNCEGSRNVKVYRLSEIYPEMGDCVRMEDSCCIAGEYLIFVSTKEQPLDGNQVPIRRQPWNAVYKTHLRTGKTERLTPQGVADINPAVSPDGKKIAVASFQGRKEDKGWDGEIENLDTNIFIMDIDNPNERLKIQSNCGWPTWGSNNVLFYHSEFMYSRDIRTGTATFHWGVFRVELGNKGVVSEPTLVTSQDIFKAITPVAIDANTVVVATIRRKSEFSDVREEDQYRHIEVFSTSNKEGMKITQQSNDHKLADHYNPFVVVAVNQHGEKEKRIGYHRTRRDHYKPDGGDLTTRVDKLESTNAKVELFRVPGVFPSFSKCGKKLAYVDNNFKSVWVMSETCLAPTCVYETDKSVFCPVWNQSADKDILYVCYGPAFTFKEEVHILAINCERDREFGFRKNDTKPSQLTSQFNNAFPSTSPDGARIVYRSTRDFHDKEKKHKNLYIMDAEKGEKGPGFMRLTIGEFDDTHCEWSPNGDWIVFSSSRDRPPFAKDDNGLDAGYFAVYIVRPDNPNVVVKVAGSGANNIGHMNHPFFSPDMTSIVVTADLAAVSCDPLSLPLFIHSVRPYGDIFIIDIDEELLTIKTKEDAAKFQGVKNFKRMTHSKYENSTACWTGDNTLLRKEWEKSRKSSRSTTQAYFITMLNADISIDMDILDSMKSKRQRLNLPSIPACPYLNRAENWHMTGHLNLPDRLC